MCSCTCCFIFPETIIGVISVENCANDCKSFLILHSVQSIRLCSSILQIKKRGFIVIKGHVILLITGTWQCLVVAHEHMWTLVIQETFIAFSLFLKIRFTIGCHFTQPIRHYIMGLLRKQRYLQREPFKTNVHLMFISVWLLKQS